MKAPWLTKPSSILIITWMVVFGLRQLPIVIFGDLNFNVWLLLICGTILYIIGFTIGNANFLKVKKYKSKYLSENYINNLIRLIIIFSTIGALGALMRAFDFIFLRGLDYSAGLGVARLDNIRLIEETGAGTNYLSAVSRAMIGFSTVSAMVVVLRFEIISWKVARFAIFSFGIVLATSALEGGRNTIAVNFVLLASCAITRKALLKKGIPNSAQLKRIIVIMISAMVAIFTYIWVDRLSAGGNESQVMTKAIEAAFDIKFSNWISSMEIDAWGKFVFTLVGVIFYFTHGLNEMNWLLNLMDSSNISFGAYNFDLLVLVFQGLGDWNIRFNPSILDRPGVYMTALGELVIDFGLGGTLFVLFIIGYTMGVIWNRMRKHNSVASELFNAWGIAGILVSPLYSILPGFFGILVAIFLFVIFSQAKIKFF